MDILNKAIDPNYRKESFEEFKQTGDYRNLIGRYKTDFLLKLLNDVAQNDMNNDNVNYAANGGSINIKPSRNTVMISLDNDDLIILISFILDIISPVVLFSQHLIRLHCKLILCLSF